MRARTFDKEDAEAADQRAMNDPSLQRGGIIATSTGFLVFIGRDSEEHQPSDFVLVPKTGLFTLRPSETAR